ncbi:MAG: hypothetical protein RLY16_1357 [Bacteroidota bacterium]|jgi:glycosyltransferase involved in cell wall biosynthesis
MHSGPLFTVVTISYNSARWIQQAIESVLASSCDDFEYIIADDCSTDNSWEIIQSYQNEHIRSWRNPTNIGEYPNRNKALAAAKGKYLLFVDGDDILMKHTLRNLSEYIQAFPDAAMIWGVSPLHIDFAVMPYLIEPEMMMRLMYETQIPLASIGFSETIFRIDTLRRVGNLPERFVVGDTYLKKRIALEEKVLLVSMGFIFWRRSENQASQIASKSHRGFIESFLIDCELLNQCTLPHKQELLLLTKASFLRRLFKHTIRKGKFALFFKLLQQSGLKWSDFRYILKRYPPPYAPVQNTAAPLMNKFNFTKIK